MTLPKKIVGLAHHNKLIIYGLREGKPQAALFEDTSSVRETAKSLALNVIKIITEDTMAVATQLSVGKLEGFGRVFIPFVKREVYDILVKLDAALASATQHVASNAQSEPAFKMNSSVAHSDSSETATIVAKTENEAEQALSKALENDDEFDRAAPVKAIPSVAEMAKAALEMPEIDTAYINTDGTLEELVDAWYWLIRPGKMVLAAELDNYDRAVAWWVAEVVSITDEAYMVQFPSDMKAGIVSREQRHIAVLIPKTA